MLNTKPILVTGLPRSGTGWVGKMIAQAPSVRYIHEPFNISSPSCSCGVQFDYWFHYVSHENEADYGKHIKHTLGSSLNRFQLQNMIMKLRMTKRFRVLTEYATSLTARRVLMKDPLALCSAEWLASAFAMDVVVVIRHPAAIANSYKKLGWSHPFSHFLSQPSLIKDYLYPFIDEINEFVDNEHDIIDQAALLWKLLYHIISQYQQTHTNWHFVRYGDLLQDPVSGFQAIFDKLILEFSDRVRCVVREHSRPANPKALGDPYSSRRSSRQVAGKWRTELASEEIERIRRRVGNTANLFYDAEDWWTITGS